MEKLKNLLKIFFTFFKIGLFTFGGGYAMIPIIQREIVEKKGWISSEEYLDIIAIAESSPGPIAINTATFVGYKVQKFFGSIIATLGVVLPSFIIVFIISLFFEQFLALEYVGYAFRGVQTCVAFLILSAGIKMMMKLEKTTFSCVVFGLALLAFVVIELLAVNFSTIFLILLGGCLGLSSYLIKYIKNKPNKEKK